MAGINKAIIVGIFDQFPCLRPMLGMGFKSVYPVHVPLPRHDRHIVPGCMSSEGKEIQMLPGNFNGSLQRTFSVPHGVVIMKVTPVELSIGSCRDMNRCCPVDYYFLTFFTHVQL